MKGNHCETVSHASVKLTAATRGDERTTEVGTTARFIEARAARQCLSTSLYAILAHQKVHMHELKVARSFHAPRISRA